MLTLLPVLAFCFVFLRCRKSRMEWRNGLLVAAAIVGACLVLGTELLSAVNLVTRGGVTVFWLVVCAATFAIWRWGADRGPIARPYAETSDEPLDAATKYLLFGAAILAVLIGVTALLAPPNVWDAMEYPCPAARAVFGVHRRNPRDRGAVRCGERWRHADDETALPRMLALAQTGSFDIVIGSRDFEGGSMGDFAANRVWLSNMGSRISNFVCKCRVCDPMSGYFLVTQEFFQSVARRLTGTGLKILVDILASAERPVRVAEVPYHFRARRNGVSKLEALLAKREHAVDAYIQQNIPNQQSFV